MLGDPVERSLSPAIHTAALAAANIDGTYTARQVDEAGVDAACEEIRLGSLTGANVTMPHKAAAARAADDLTAVAARAGAVNTLSAHRGGVVGDNTDVGGITDAWFRRDLPRSGPVLVLGSGGAAAAALLALEGRDLAASSRRSGAISALAIRLGVDCREVAWGSPVEGATLVNATPLGMRGETLPTGLLEAAVGFYDLAYGPGATPAVRAAARMGLPIVDGIDMLVAQAALSFERWTGVRPSIQVMEQAVRSA